MKPTDWKSIAELIGISAIVVSLIFVGIQLQQDRDLAQVASYGSVTESTNGLSELVQNNSDVWVRGLNGEDLDDAESAVFISIVRAVEQRYMNFFVRWRASRAEELDPQLHIRQFAYYIYMYPGLRKVYEDELKVGQNRSTAFGTPTKGVPLYESASPYLKLLDDAQPVIPVNKTYVIW